MGTWIEILHITTSTEKRESRSLRGNVDRNLKLKGDVVDEEKVVPYVGTWIEISEE